MTEVRVPADTLLRLSKPDLVLADLTGPALKLLGLNNDISSGDGYKITQAWAQAIRAADPKWDGIRYVSRQHNTEYAVAVFEDATISVANTRPLEGVELDRLCDRFNVVV